LHFGQILASENSPLHDEQTKFPQASGATNIPPRFADRAHWSPVRPCEYLLGSLLADYQRAKQFRDYIRHADLPSLLVFRAPRFESNRSPHQINLRDFAGGNTFPLTLKSVRLTLRLRAQQFSAERPQRKPDHNGTADNPISLDW
jgi:hypothetical protein